MSRSILIVIVLLVIAIPLGFLAITGSKQNATPQYVPNTSTSSSQTTTTSVTNSEIPIPLSNSFLRWANINYGIEGILYSTAPTSEGAELITNITGDTIPKLFVTSKTEVVLSNNAKGSLADLKPNQKIQISLNYRMMASTNKWELLKVRIINPKPKTTPTP